MNKHWHYFIYMLWLSYLITLNILMFSRGFLTNRVVQKDRSICTNNTCLKPRSKLVIVVVDALRYDFAVYNESFDNPLAYQNKLTVFRDVMRDHPQHSRFYRLHVDPPTSTMQRLQAMCTGSLPTFIEIGSNFGTHVIDEDNIIEQMQRNALNVVFLGDDTWLKMFHPSQFHRSYPFPSLDVWDLDTVDNGINTHVLTEMNRTDWHVIIAHYLGVDHAGHRYGALHTEMARKLTEIDASLRKIIVTLPRDATLMVLGDHGMTNTGDHGGSSERETSAAMFVYSREILTNTPWPDRVKQIDFVATVATILGVPIPFSNLGRIILNALPQIDENERTVVDALIENVKQVDKYLHTYISHNNVFKNDTIAAINTKYKQLRGWIDNKPNLTEVDFNNLTSYIDAVRDAFEDEWIQFDGYLMSRGLLLIFLTLFSNSMIVGEIPPAFLHAAICNNYLLVVQIFGVVTALVAHALYFSRVINASLMTVYFSTGVLSVVVFVLIIVRYFKDISLAWYETSTKQHVTETMAKCVLLVSMLSLFSNSYIMEESNVTYFLTISLVCLNTYRVVDESQKIRKTYVVLLAVVACVLLKLSTAFHKCREEQEPYCVNLTRPHAIGWQTIVALVGMAVFVTTIKLCLRACGNLCGYSLNVLIVKYVPTIACVSLGCYWLLIDLPVDFKTRIIATTWTIDIFAWIIYACALLAIVNLFVQPLHIFIYNRGSTIAQLFKRVKSKLHNDDNDYVNTPVVYGLDTVYSSSFIVLTMFVMILYVLLLQSHTANAAVLVWFAAAAILAVFGCAKNLKVGSSTKLISDLFNVENSKIICWMLMCNYAFYATGHQPAFPNINWNVAFIGTDGKFINSFISGALILMNTFGSHILFGVTVPLLIIVPFTINAIVSGTIKKSDQAHGEFYLFQHGDTFMSHLFVVNCKYVIFHAARLFIAMFSATIHCRHLMVWSIFAPKFIFEAIALLFTIVAVLLNYLFVFKINRDIAVELGFD